MGSERPVYILFAGVNGAGKSTLFQSGMWEHGEVDSSFPRVNSDELLAAHGWDWRDASAQLRAGREAVTLIRGYLDSKRSFNQETTLSGKTIMRTIERARRLGYLIVMFYVGVEDPDIANNRIAHRTAVGGHGIDPAVVNRRYGASIGNLLGAIELCDETYLYDNTSLLTLVARFERDELAYANLDIPGISWHRSVIEQLGYREFRLGGE